MTISLQGFSPEIAAVIQDETLIREFFDALYPNLLFRAEARVEEWPAQIGETTVFTRTGLMGVNTKPLTPGSDPTPGSYPVEQWRATASQYGDALDSNMPTSYVALNSTFLEDTKKLGLNSGQTLNRIVRDRLFRAYLSGDTVAIAPAGVGASQLVVASINGFSELLANGRVVSVSALTPIPVSFTGAEPANQVIAAVPLDADDPFGPGILTLAAVLTVGIALREGVKSNFRTEIVRVGGGATVDSLTGTEILTLQDVINAVATLRDNNVPTFEDGRYHVHLSPQGEAQLFADNQFQRLNQSLPDDVRYKELLVGDLIGCYFYRNRENPKATNVGDLVDTSGGGGSAEGAPELGAEIRNQGGIEIRRAIVVGAGAIYEKAIDEGAYITEAGVQGRIGSFSIVNNGVQIMTEGIRFILRAPQDRLQQVVGQAWSWSGDWPVPSDGTTNGPSTFKRSICIEHA
ncbi:MAG TPA: hypothetical protein ENK57_11930 [Polyangiaceae bacterium]|nr:hypothetical protein [Polyangiaceae bacterium]